MAGVSAVIAERWPPLAEFVVASRYKRDSLITIDGVTDTKQSFISADPWGPGNNACGEFRACCTVTILCLYWSDYSSLLSADVLYEWYQSTGLD